MIYLDSNVVIRLVEGDNQPRQQLELRLFSSLGKPGTLVTSRLTRLERRTKPLKTSDFRTLAQFDVFFAGQELMMIEVTESIIELATELRARFNLRTPDALHYATAVVCGARVFLTGDLAFARLTEIPVELL